MRSLMRLLPRQWKRSTRVSEDSNSSFAMKALKSCRGRYHRGMSISRRTLLKTATASAIALPYLAKAQESDHDKIILSAPLTHSDRTIKEGIAWGPDGVHHMLDACKACGWSRVHWRALDGGK